MIWIGLRRGTVFPLNPLTGLFGFAGRRGYMVPDSGLRALIAATPDDPAARSPSDPLHVVATDVLTGRVEALQSSCRRDRERCDRAILPSSCDQTAARLPNVQSPRAHWWRAQSSRANTTSSDDLAMHERRRTCSRPRGLVETRAAIAASKHMFSRRGSYKTSLRPSKRHGQTVQYERSRRHGCTRADR